MFHCCLAYLLPARRSHAAAETCLVYPSVDHHVPQIEPDFDVEMMTPASAEAVMDRVV